MPKTKYVFTLLLLAAVFMMTAVPQALAGQQFLIDSATAPSRIPEDSISPTEGTCGEVITAYATLEGKIEATAWDLAGNETKSEASEFSENSEV